jgi:hypothetical protein
VSPNLPKFFGDYRERITKMNKTVAPSTAETAFNCPHCGAFTTQFWYHLFAEQMTGDRETPLIPKRSMKEKLDPKEHDGIIEWIDRMVGGFVFFEKRQQAKYLHLAVQNLFLSKCYNCKKIAVWVNERLVFPESKYTTAPNPDLPDNIVRDYEEARSIVDLSPRAAAALLRLAIQKLSVHLGGSGKT